MLYEFSTFEYKSLILLRKEFSWRDEFKLLIPLSYYIASFKIDLH